MDYDEFRPTQIKISLEAYNDIWWEPIYTEAWIKWVVKPIIFRLAVTLFQYHQITKTDDDDG